MGFVNQPRSGSFPSTHTAFKGSGISDALTLQFHRRGNRGTNKSTFPSLTGPEPKRQAPPIKAPPIFTPRPLPPTSAVGPERGGLSRASQFPDTGETPCQCLAPHLLHTDFGSREPSREEPRVPLVQALGAESPGQTANAGSHSRPQPPIAPCCPILELQPRRARSVQTPRNSRERPLVPGELSSVWLWTLACFSFLPLIYRLF